VRKIKDYVRDGFTTFIRYCTISSDVGLYFKVLKMKSVLSARPTMVLTVFTSQFLTD
jgi:hypothetical protein